MKFFEVSDDIKTLLNPMFVSDAFIVDPLKTKMQIIALFFVLELSHNIVSDREQLSKIEAIISKKRDLDCNDLEVFIDQIATLIKKIL